MVATKARLNTIGQYYSDFKQKTGHFLKAEHLVHRLKCTHSYADICLSRLGCDVRAVDNSQLACQTNTALMDLQKLAKH